MYPWQSFIIGILEFNRLQGLEGMIGSPFTIYFSIAKLNNALKNLKSELAMDFDF